MMQRGLRHEFAATSACSLEPSQAPRARSLVGTCRCDSFVAHRRDHRSGFVASRCLPKGLADVAPSARPRKRIPRGLGGVGLNPVRQFRAAIFESGTLLAVAERGGAAPADAEYEHGFIRPRSLTPFAPLESDLFLPDAGVAARSDLSALTGRSLTKTSPNR